MFQHLLKLIVYIIFNIDILKYIIKYKKISKIQINKKIKRTVKNNKSHFFKVFIKVIN